MNGNTATRTRILAPLLLFSIIVITPTLLSQDGRLDTSPFTKDEASRTYTKIPVKGNVKLTSTFGEWRYDHFHNGVDLGGRKMTITPLYEGEIIYYHDEEDDPTRPVYGPGNIIIMEHDRRLRTYYYHVQEGSIEKHHGRVGDDEAIGVTGNSGASFGPHLHLTVEDIESNKAIDPLTLLPPFNDTTPPTVSIYLKRHGYPRSTLLHNNMRMRFDRDMEILVRTYDLHGNTPSGVRKIIISVDGDVKRYYDFSFLIKKDFRYYVAPNYPFEEVYAKASHVYRGGMFTPSGNNSTHTFTAIVEDFGGNIAMTEVKVTF